MRLSFLNQGKSGSITIKNGEIATLDIDCDRKKSLLFDLLKLDQDLNPSLVEDQLKKIGLSHIEIIAEEADTLDHMLLEANFYGSVILQEKKHTILRKAYGYENIKKGMKNKVPTYFHAGRLSEIAAAPIIHQQLPLDDSLSQFFPAHATRYPHLGSITPRMLLSHTSGIGPLFARKIPFDHLLPTRVQVDQIFKKPLLFEPGKYRSYTAANFRLLGAILEYTLGKSYRELAETYLPSGVSVADEKVCAIDYLSDGNQIEKDHISLRSCFDDLSANVSGLMQLCEKAKPYLQESVTAKVFQSSDVITTACGFICDFIHGKRIYFREFTNGLLFFVPSVSLKVALIANKPMNNNLSMKKIISFITTNHF